MKHSKKRIIATLTAGLTFVSVFCMYPTRTHAFSGDGAGTSDNPYRIETCDQLQEAGNSLAAYYILVANIDCSGIANFDPIGSLSDIFTGTFDGQGFSISNLTITADPAGLFTYPIGATIKNVNVVGGTITSPSAQASTFAYNAQNTTLTNVTSTATIDGQDTVGGLVSGLSGSSAAITKSSFNGSITAHSTTSGGLAGMIRSGATISNSYSKGTLNGTSSVGGIAGSKQSGAGTISKTYSAMTINASGTDVGGLVGDGLTGSLTISDSLFGGSITAASATIGGIVGDGTSTTMTNDYYIATTCTNCTNGAAGSGSDTGGTSISSIATDGSAAPLTSWDLSTIWQTISGDLPNLIQPTAPVVPSVPANFTATKVGNVPTLSWSAPITAGGGTRTDYQIHYKASTDTGWTVYSHTASGSLTGVRFDELTIGKTYTFRVRAYNSTVNGAWATSNPITINGGVPSGLKSGLVLKNISDGSDLSTTDTGGTVTAQLADATTGQIFSTFSLDLSTNRDVSTITALTDAATGKTVILGISDVPGASAAHTLYVPKLTGQTQVRLCPSATTLANVTTDCASGTTYSQGDTGVSIVTMGTKTYWVISGLTGTGGVGITLAASTTTIAATTSASVDDQELADTGMNIFYPLTVSLLLLCGSSSLLIWNYRKKIRIVLHKN